MKKTKKIKKFSFDINEPYEENVIGKKETSKQTVVLVPNFAGKTLTYVNSFCSPYGIKVNVNGNNSGTVISQNVPSGSNVEDVSSITINMSGGTTNRIIEKKEDSIQQKENTPQKKEVDNQIETTDKTDKEEKTSP